MKVVVGLGNPGAQYARTRHNAGWLALDILAQRVGASFVKKDAFQAEIAEWRIGSEKILLVKPQTFMNRSGDAVQPLLAFFKVAPMDLLIVHDEMDFIVGRLAFTANGRPGGHNGVASIQERLGTTALPRLRIGIGRPVSPLKPEDYVLQGFGAEDAPLVAATIQRASQAVEDWIAHGTTAAMNHWNRSAETPATPAT